MPILPIPSLNILVKKVAETMENVSPNHNNQRHVLHHVLKRLGNLPTPLIERFNRYLHSPTPEQYPHADAHLRLIIGVSNKLKRPLHITQLVKLRQSFAKDAVGLQSPTVWQQPINDTDSNSDSKNKISNNKEQFHLVSWLDQKINNADDGLMTIRCYQAQDGSQQGINKSNNKNLDKTAMLFFHGGGFCIGDVDTHHEFCHRVCAQTGWTVVSVDYRLAPEHPAPTALRDCLAAYSWLAKQCHTLGLSPSRIVLSGDSAGGCLATLVAQQITAPSKIQWQGLGEDNIADDTATNGFIASFIDKLQDLPQPLALMPLYPVTDIANDYPSWALYGQGLLLDHNDIEVFDAAYVQNSPLTQSHALISPMNGDNTSMCPSYIVAAELDILRDEGLAYAKQLEDDGIQVKVHTVLGAPHGFIHLMSVHKGIECETAYIINEFTSFVRQLLAAEDNTTC